MLKVVVAFLMVLIGAILCINRNYPQGYMSTPSYPKQTMDKHFAVINMIRNTESKIKQMPIDSTYMTIAGVILIIAGIVFYFM